MAILFSQADGSDQHYDTYEEFEQAMVLMSRIGSNKVPQDLLDEVKAKYGDKETKPLQVKIDGNNFESAFREAVRDVGEELDSLSKERTPESDEERNVEIIGGGEDGYGWVGKDGVEVVEEDSPTEFENDDLVRVTESFRDSFGDVAKINSILPVIIDGDGRVLGVGTVLIGDNHDKLRLVCRREDRKDTEL